MTSSQKRAYNCKDEELPVICNFAAFSLQRDLVDFTAFSPKFNPEYVNGFETAIASVNDVVMPNSETLELKNITARMYDTMDGLIDPINRVSGYLKMAQPGLNISSTDFGLSELRKNCNTKNAEGVVSNIRTVSANLTKYATELGEQGLTPELAGSFTAAATSIEADNEQQYEIVSNRKTIVQSNLNLFNSLYEQLTEILRVGKILYKAKDAVKHRNTIFLQ